MRASPNQLTTIPGSGTICVLGQVPASVLGVLKSLSCAADVEVVTEPLQLSVGAALRHQRPQLIVVGPTDGDRSIARAVVAYLAQDQRLQTVPLVVVDSDAGEDWFENGADEVIGGTQLAAEESLALAARLRALLRRVRRDQEVHPSTRLPGSDAIRAAIAHRIRGNDTFAACYADLDHFKEFNDRYGFAEGDSVIRAMAELLVAQVEATAGADGFVGHIGGDDFLFLVPAALAAATCEAIIREADQALPQRYSAHDRQAGYFFGKDRRGRLDRVPLMTLSIGVVTNERRRFSTPEQVSELATEMKSYAKSRAGSLWVADRRGDDTLDSTNEESQA
jgi:GGDEF domain-containing protein